MKPEKRKDIDMLLNLWLNNRLARINTFLKTDFLYIQKTIGKIKVFIELLVF